TNGLENERTHNDPGGGEMHKKRRSALFVGAVVAALIAAGAAQAGSVVTVMTRNLYFGADLGPVVRADSPGPFFASVGSAYDVEAPGIFPSGFVDVRLTQHEVILARGGAGLLVSNPQTGQYGARASIPTALGIPIELPWSWASVDVTKGGKRFRFATTHLDP